VPNADRVDPSGDETFDRARAYLAELREEEALDWFEIAASAAHEPADRASAAAFVAALLLAGGRPWEVETWADLVVIETGRPDLGDMLKAAASLQQGDVAGARLLMDGVAEPSDPWFPCSVAAAWIMRAHIAYLEGEHTEAERIVRDTFALDPLAPDVWDALARLCADTDFDPVPFVSAVPDDRVLEVLAALRSAEPAGVDRIAECVWERNQGDPRVLALVPGFAPKLDNMRALEWSARLRASGMGRLCPLLARAERVDLGAAERAQGAALVFASFGDRRAREALEAAVADADDEELPRILAEVWAIAGMLTDSVVVVGAVTPARALLIAAGLYDGGAPDEAYAVLVHGLAMEAAETLTTETVVSALPLRVLRGLAEQAVARGEQDVAGILEAVAVVAEG